MYLLDNSRTDDDDDDDDDEPRSMIRERTKAIAMV